MSVSSNSCVVISILGHACAELQGLEKGGGRPKSVLLKYPNLYRQMEFLRLFSKLLMHILDFELSSSVVAHRDEKLARSIAMPFSIS